MSPPGRRALRAFRLLLALFPAGFRDEHGPGMERLFLETRADWEERHGRAGVRFWLAIGWDTVVQASAERLASVRRAGGWLASLGQDVRFAFRQLRRRPLAGLLVILLMAVGIAGNAAVFRIVNGLFLKPLPFPDAERLVDLDETAPRWNLEYVSVSYPDFRAWRGGNRTFEAMAAYDFGSANLASPGSGGEEGAVRVPILAATHDLDDVLRLEPLRGRFFTEEEDAPGAPTVALVSEDAWSSHFARDPDIVGRTVELDGVGYEVIGVLPPEARFMGDADFWGPLRRGPDDDSGYSFSAVGRLRPGVTVERAREDLAAVHAALEHNRSMDGATSPVVSSLRDRFLGDFRLPSGLLLGAVVAVLLVACANIAGLMMARSLARDREMAIRRTLGAGRGRVVRQLLTESAVLALLGAAGGTWLGVWGSSRLLSGLGDRFPSFVRFDPDGRVLAFTAALTGGAVLLFGLLPAIRGARREASALTTRSTPGRGRRRGMSLLVAGEVAVAMTLLIVSGVAVLDVVRLSRADPGFETEEVLSYALTLPGARYADDVARVRFVEEYLERLGALPGVEGAAVASSLPTTGHWGWFYRVAGAEAPREGEADPVVLTRSVSPGYFGTMGVELVSGRVLNDHDGRDGGGRSVVVNETFVRTFFPGSEDPVGARITTAGGGDPMTIVGVTRDVKHYGADEPMRPGVYQPLRQLPVSSLWVALRVAADPVSLAGAARRATAELDPGLAIHDVRTMDERMRSALWSRRATSWLIAAFSVVTLALAVAGLFGLISYGVGQRSREISIRMAMGARAGEVRRRVVREGMSLALAGVAVGLLAAFAATGLLSHVLVGVGARDWRVFAGVTLLVLAVAAAANELPARRAARLDPMRWLRGD